MPNVMFAFKDFFFLSNCVNLIIILQSTLQYTTSKILMNIKKLLKKKYQNFKSNGKKKHSLYVSDFFYG
jgi:hypothetical protein